MSEIFKSLSSDGTSKSHTNNNHLEPTAEARKITEDNIHEVFVVSSYLKWVHRGTKLRVSKSKLIDRNCVREQWRRCCCRWRFLYCDACRNCSFDKRNICQCRQKRATEMLDENYFVQKQAENVQLANWTITQICILYKHHSFPRRLISCTLSTICRLLASFGRVDENAIVLTFDYNASSKMTTASQAIRFVD